MADLVAGRASSSPLRFRWLAVRRNDQEGGVAVGPVLGGWWKGQKAAGLWGRRYCVIAAARGSDPVLASWPVGSEGDRLLLWGLVEAGLGELAG